MPRTSVSPGQANIKFLSRTTEAVTGELGEFDSCVIAEDQLDPVRFVRAENGIYYIDFNGDILGRFQIGDQVTVTWQASKQVAQLV